MGSANSVLTGIKTFGGDVKDILVGGFSGASAGAGIGTAIEPGFGTAIGGVIGGVVGLIPGITGTIKDIVHYSHHQANPATQGGPSLLQLAQSASQSRAAALAANASDKNVQAFQSGIMSGMTAGGAFISSGLTRLPGLMAQGQLNGVFTRAPGVNPRTALLLGNGAMRAAMAQGAVSSYSQLHSPYMDALYGYGHAMSSNLYAPSSSSVSSFGVGGAAQKMSATM